MFIGWVAVIFRPHCTLETASISHQFTFFLLIKMLPKNQSTMVGFIDISCCYNQHDKKEFMAISCFLFLLSSVTDKDQNTLLNGESCWF